MSWAHADGDKGDAALAIQFIRACTPSLIYHQLGAFIVKVNGYKCSVGFQEGYRF